MLALLLATGLEELVVWGLLLWQNNSLFWGNFPFKKNDIYRHPTQLYESFGYFLTYFLLLAQSNRKNILNGSIFGWGLFFHELVRFIVEFFRENTLYFLQLPHLTLSSAQLVDIILMVMSLIFLHYFVYNKIKIEIKISQWQYELLLSG